MNFGSQVASVLFGTARRGFAFFLVVILINVGKPSSGETTRVFNVGEPVTQWHLGRESGNVYALTAKTLLMFDRKGEGKPTPLEFRGIPFDLVEKSNHLVIAARNPESLVLVNLVTQEQRVVKLPTAAGFLLTASSQPSPWVYVVELGSPNTRLLQVDVEAGSVTRTHEARDLHITPRSAAIVPTGRYIIFDDRDIRTFDEVNVTLGPRGKPLSRGTKYDSLGRNWLRGNELLELDFTRTDVRFAGENAVFTPASAAVISLVRLEANKAPMLMVESRAGEVISATRLKIPEVKAQSTTRRSSRRSSRSKSQRNQLQITEDGDRLLFVDDDRAVTVELTDPQFKLQQQLFFEPMHIDSLLVEKEAALPIRLHAAKGTQDIQLTMKEGPDGAKLKERKLMWTPGLDDIGIHRVTLNATSENFNDSYSFNLNVSPPNVVLDGRISSTYLDPEGRQAAAFSLDKGILSLIDLSSMRITAQKSIKDIHSLLLHGENVWITNFRKLRCLDRETLEDRTSVELANSLALRGATKRELILASSSSRLVLDLKTLKPVDQPQAMASFLPRGLVNLGGRILTRDGRVLYAEKNRMRKKSSGRGFDPRDMNWTTMTSSFRGRLLDIRVGEGVGSGEFAIAVNDVAENEIIRMDFPKLQTSWRGQKVVENRLVFFRGNVLYRYDFPESILPRLAPEMQIIAPPAKLRTLAPNVTIKLAVKNATGKPTYAVPKSEYLSIDENGNLSVQAKPMWENTRALWANVGEKAIDEYRYGVFRKIATAKNVPAGKAVVSTRVFVAAMTEDGREALTNLDLEFLINKSELQIDKSRTNAGAQVARQDVRRQEIGRPSSDDEIEATMTRLEKKMNEALRRLEAIERRR